VISRAGGNRSRARRLFSVILLTTLVPSIALTGCGPSEPTEISAETSGYRPAGKDTTAATPSEVTSNAAPAASTKASPASSSAEGLPPAPDVPEFDAGKLDPKIAAKEYMRLQLTKARDLPSLMKFMETSTRCMKELFADAQRRLLSPDILMSRAVELSRMKLEAADLIGKVATNDDEKAASILGRMESLVQLVSFNDAPSMQDLKALVSQEIANSDPRISQQAKSLALGLLIADHQSGKANNDELIAMVDSLLKVGQDSDAGPNPGFLAPIAQAIDSLDSKSAQEDATKIAKRVEEGFRDSSNAQAAMGAWQLYVARLPEMQLIEDGLNPQSTAPKVPEQTKQAIKALMTKVPSPWTTIYLIEMAIQVEYSGSYDIAKTMIEVAETQIDKVKDVKNRDKLDRNCKQFQKRIGVLNKPLDLSDLVDLKGNAINLEQYKGKVVLVDLWASWCGPCIQEIPNIERVYKEKKDKGFEVIGINLDEDRAKLDDFLSARSLDWNTYVPKSDSKDNVGFQSPFVQSIGVSAIPFIAVLGRDGKVAAIHVRGEKLAATIDGLLAQ
jgi:thiol-disulfide isomerase/thioredoxin